MKTAIAALVASSSTAALADKAESEPLVLPPTSPWAMDYAADSCRLIRKFGDGAQETVLFMERYGPSVSFNMRVAGQPLADPDNRMMSVRFGPAAPRKVAYMHGSLAGTVPEVLFYSQSLLPAADDEDGSKNGAEDDAARDERLAALEKGVREIGFSEALHPPLVLQTGSLGDAFAAMRTCTDELVRHWGVDLDAQKTLTRHPIPRNSPGSWISPSDYPSAAISKGFGGVIHFRLTVDAEGRPSDCAVQGSSNPETFDKVVCDTLMRRARFRPALDRDGKPIVSYYLNTVRFTMPS